MNFDENIDENIDESSWMKKRIEEWNSNDTTYWYLATAVNIGARIHELEPFDYALPGKQFLKLTKQEFLNREKNFGHQFYEELHKRHHLEKLGNKLILF